MMDFTSPEPDDEPISVVPFPALHNDALSGLPGKLVQGALPYTEAHPAPMLVQYLARFGCTIGPGAHVWIDNRRHPARLNPLVVGKTSEGAKGTSYGVISALFASAEQPRPTVGARRGSLASSSFADPLRQVSGLSSGEGVIELVRDPNGDDPEARNFDEGVADKRLLVIEEEFSSVLDVSKRDGSTLPRVIREAWDGITLRTLTRSNALCATGAHIVIIGHVTPGELRIKLNEAAMLGGTMNRFLPVASRRTKLLSRGGNLPAELLAEYGPLITEAVAEATVDRRIEHTADAWALWDEQYPHLRRGRPDGSVARILARSAPQVHRIALAYALADRSQVIDRPHMAAALALWQYVEDTAEWMFGAHIDTADLDRLVLYIATGDNGRTKSEITNDFYSKNKSAAEIDTILGELIKDGRIRQEKDQRSGPGRRAVRYHA